MLSHVNNLCLQYIISMALYLSGLSPKAYHCSLPYEEMEPNITSANENDRHIDFMTLTS